MEENDIVVGCANPYSLAEEIAGKRIDWSKEADEFETLAKCFGITKEGFLSDESPIESPILGWTKRAFSAGFPTRRRRIAFPPSCRST